jgi:S1/P1 Nuclease
MSETWRVDSVVGRKVRAGRLSACTRYLVHSTDEPCELVRILLIFLSCSSIPFTSASAWNATGHKIVASIAFRQLAPTEQERIVDLLKRHPRFTEDFAEEMPEEIRSGGEGAQQEWIFQQAAVWPDLIRPPGAEAKIAFHRSQWHYVNVPLFLDEAARRELSGKLTLNTALDPPTDATVNTEPLNVVQAIRFARRQCASSMTNPQSRGLLLAWLYHDVGDIHQPLHGAALVSRRLFPEGDRGGNSIKTTQSFNLHSLWDQFPWPAADYKSCRDRAIAVVGTPEFSAVGKCAEAVLDEKEWLLESHALAREVTYSPDILAAVAKAEAGGGLAPLEMKEEYLKIGGRIAERRLIEAGYRLGAVLKTIAAE